MDDWVVSPVAPVWLHLSLPWELQRLTEENHEWKTFPNWFIFFVQPQFKFWIFFVDLGCALQITFWKLMKKMVLILGPPLRERKCLGRKQTHVEPNVNRCCPIELTSHIHSQLSKFPQKTSGPPPQNAEMAPPYWGYQRYGIILLSYNTHYGHICKLCKRVYHFQSRYSIDGKLYRGWCGVNIYMTNISERSNLCI